MKIKPGKLDLAKLSRAYAQAGRDLLASGAELERAARALEECRLGEAERAIQAGLDQLGAAIKAIPRA